MTAPDPGNLPARMAEVIGSHEWDDFPRSAHNQHSYYGACAVCQRDIPRMAEVACGVRDELVAHLSARTAEAEARVGHAEAGAELSSERLAKVRQELAEAQAEAGRLRIHLRAQRQETWLHKTRASEADTAIAALRDLRNTIATSTRRLTRREIARQFDAALDVSALRALDSKEILSSSVEAERDAPVEGTTTPARENA